MYLSVQNPLFVHLNLFGLSIFTFLYYYFVFFCALSPFTSSVPLCMLELDALDCNDELTPLGRILARLPIEPRLGKMMILGCIFQLVAPAVFSDHRSSCGV